MIKVKRGASIVGCRKEILIALIDIDSIFAVEDVDTVVTSGCENYKHSAKRSAHYRGDGIDARSRHLSSAAKKRVLAKIKRKLGKNFVVILENIGKASEHYHIHWSPVFN